MGGGDGSGDGVRDGRADDEDDSDIVGVFVKGVSDESVVVGGAGLGD